MVRAGHQTGQDPGWIQQRRWQSKEEAEESERAECVRCSQARHRLRDAHRGRHAGSTDRSQKHKLRYESAHACREQSRAPKAEWACGR